MCSSVCVCVCASLSAGRSVLITILWTQRVFVKVPPTPLEWKSLEVGVESFAPGVLRIFPRGGCGDWNVQKSDGKTTENPPKKNRQRERRRERSCLRLLFVLVLSGMLILAEPKFPLIHPTCLLSVPEDNMTSKGGFLLTKRISSVWLK